MIDSLVALLNKSNAVFITEYRGLTVKKMSDCRKRIREAGGEMKVCKNTLMRIALTEAGITHAPEFDSGPNGYVLSYGDVAVAKAIRDFSKEKGNEALIVKAAILDGKILTKDQIFALAEAPLEGSPHRPGRRHHRSPSQGTCHSPFGTFKGTRHMSLSDQGQEGSGIAAGVRAADLPHSSIKILKYPREDELI